MIPTLIITFKPPQHFKDSKYEKRVANQIWRAENSLCHGI